MEHATFDPGLIGHVSRAAGFTLGLPVPRERKSEADVLRSVSGGG